MLWVPLSLLCASPPERDKGEEDYHNKSHDNQAAADADLIGEKTHKGREGCRAGCEFSGAQGSCLFFHFIPNVIDHTH